MESVIYKGISNSFEGLILDSEKNKGTAFTFYSKDKAYIYNIVNLSDSSRVYEVHSKLSELLSEEIDLQYTLETFSFVIDLTPLVASVEEMLGVTFKLELEEVKLNIRTASSTLYNTYMSFNGHLYPISHIETGDKATDLYFGTQLVLVVATDLERFPSAVSYNILQRHIDLVSKERILGKKIVNLNKILAKGLHVSYLWTV